MCHLSPTVHLAWAILAVGLQIFLIQHLWRYDRFKCLSWSSGRQPGAFKRIMTYSYLTSVPSLVVYSCALAVLKYRNGYTLIPGHGIVPTPYQLWSQADQSWLKPLYIVFAVAWGLELVTHLEELMFWLFLIHQGPERRDWFSSYEFRTWAIGSCLAIAGMPVTAILTGSNPLKAEAYIFLVGGAASFLVTVVFFVVLAKFPTFLRQVKKEGAATPVVLRLVKFHELNILRVIFRICLTLPLLILGIDGVREKHVINESPLWTDLLAFCAAVGLVASSTMTLLIFFPRSLAEDSNWRPRTSDSHSQTQTHASFVSGNGADRGRPDMPRPLFTTKLSYNANGLYKQPSSPTSYMDGNPFQDPLMERYGHGSPITPGSGAPILTRTKIRNYNGSTLQAVSYDYMETDGQYELKHMQNSLSSDDSKAQLSANVELERDLATLTHPTPLVKGEDSQQRYGKPDAKDNRIKMMELGQVIETGLKKPQRPPRPHRLHPYITSFHSPIDLMVVKEASEGPHAV
ncbi:hypothetical protein M422DRAFT_26678 [Sphaerobolus stellatus SS14]|nr:hypothetical protein M422DRAFT_26678 [Sphaerobolus stellatus SS14]